MFNQHKFETTVLGCPDVKISFRAATDMWILTDLVDTEVGWLTTARMVKNGANRTIHVDDVYLFRQQVHSTTTELTAQGLAELGAKLIEEDQAANIPPDQWRANNLRGYFHSHVNMDVSPSQQDNDQTLEFRDKYGAPWVLRGIVNKKRKMKLDLYWFEMDMVINDIDWEVDYTTVGDRQEHWESAVDNLVGGFESERSVTPISYQSRGDIDTGPYHSFQQREEGLSFRSSIYGR